MNNQLALNHIGSTISTTLFFQPPLASAATAAANRTSDTQLIMAKSRITETPPQQKVVQRATKKKRSPETATNSAKAGKSVTKITKGSSTSEPETALSEQVEASETSTEYTPLSAADASDLGAQSNDEILPEPSPSPSIVEFACDARELNDYIQTLKSSIYSNNNHVILSNILIEADAETMQLHLTAYNLEFGIQASFEAKLFSI